MSEEFELAMNKLLTSPVEVLNKQIKAGRPRDININLNICIRPAESHTEDCSDQSMRDEAVATAVKQEQSDDQAHHESTSIDEGAVTKVEKRVLPCGSRLPKALEMQVDPDTGNRVLITRDRIDDKHYEETRLIFKY